jgi:hypothetical protein
MTDHLHTVEARARRVAARTANRSSTRPTTRPGSETCEWHPGQPVRVSATGVLRRYKGRTGWVAQVATQQFPDGRLYAEVGVSWSLRSDWAAGGSTDAWFRVDELEAR